LLPKRHKKQLNIKAAFVAAFMFKIRSKVF